MIGPCIECGKMTPIPICRCGGKGGMEKGVPRCEECRKSCLGYCFYGCRKEFGTKNGVAWCKKCDQKIFLLCDECNKPAESCGLDECRGLMNGADISRSRPAPKIQNYRPAADGLLNIAAQNPLSSTPPTQSGGVAQTWTHRPKK